MILNEHYPEQDAILSPSEFHTELKNFPKTAVTFFSKKLIKLFAKKHDFTIVAELENETMVFPVYKTKVKNRNIAVFQSPVGAPASASLLEEIIALGAENILAVGCCGCLDENLKESDLVVPNCAIRDEGLSYHYLKTKDEILLNEKMVELISKGLKQQNLPFVVGKTWTNDGLYRETSDKTSKRKKQGAIVVEMETSALASVAKFRDVNFGQILYGADSLANGNYNKRTFRGDKIPKHTEGIVEIALNCAALIDREMKKQQTTPQTKPQRQLKIVTLIKTLREKRRKAFRELRERIKGKQNEKP